MIDFIIDYPLVVLALLVIVWFIATYGGRIYRFARLWKSGITEIDRMEGGEFENYLEVLFRRKGYQVRQLVLTGDYGGDLIIDKAGQKTVIQAKRYQESVGVEAVQEAWTAQAYYETDAAMVITNSDFTRQARHLADKIGVELWDRDRLIKEILAAKGDEKPESANRNNSRPSIIIMTWGRIVSETCRLLHPATRLGRAGDSPVRPSVFRSPDGTWIASFGSNRKAGFTGKKAAYEWLEETTRTGNDQSQSRHISR